MKKILVLLTVLFTTGIIQAQQSDLIKYGLKGKVKTMQQTIYTLCRKINDKWVATDTPIYTIKTYSYNENGVLLSVEDRRIINVEHKTDFTLTRFIYSNGKLAGSEWLNEKGQKIGQSIVTWKNDTTYLDIVDDEKNNMKIETLHIIDNFGRNRKTIMKRYTNKDLDIYVTTNFSYNNGLLSGEYIDDSTRNYKLTYVMEYLTTDQYGNATENVLHNSPYKEDIPAIITYSNYEYYTD